MGNKATSVAKAVDGLAAAMLPKPEDDWRERLHEFNEAVPLWMEVR